jgi:REP element-mobilizing transposase RayT
MVVMPNHIHGILRMNQSADAVEMMDGRYRRDSQFGCLYDFLLQLLLIQNKFQILQKTLGMIKKEYEVRGLRTAGF